MSNARMAAATRARSKFQTPRPLIASTARIAPNGLDMDSWSSLEASTINRSRAPTGAAPLEHIADHRLRASDTRRSATLLRRMSASARVIQRRLSAPRQIGRCEHAILDISELAESAHCLSADARPESAEKSFPCRTPAPEDCSSRHHFLLRSV